jgi:hypothetical protein
MTGDRKLVLSLLKEQHSLHPGLGETGEFVLSEKKGESVEIIYFSGRSPEVPLSSILSPGEPAIFAASGNTGFIKGEDYRGKNVLAYADFIEELNYGLVTKIDYAEIIKPFWEASLYATIITIILVIIGLFFFKHFSEPLFERIRESEEKYHMLFELIPSGITIADNNREIIESNK